MRTTGKIPVILFSFFLFLNNHNIFWYNNKQINYLKKSQSLSPTLFTMISRYCIDNIKLEPLTGSNPDLFPQKTSA